MPGTSTTIGLLPAGTLSGRLQVTVVALTDVTAHAVPPTATVVPATNPVPVMVSVWLVALAKLRGVAGLGRTLVTAGVAAAAYAKVHRPEAWAQADGTPLTSREMEPGRATANCVNCAGRGANIWSVEPSRSVTTLTAGLVPCRPEMLATRSGGWSPGLRMGSK